MIEDPRNNAPQDEDADEDDSYDDEISLDELEGDTSGFFDTFDVGTPLPEQPPERFSESRQDAFDDEFDDEVTLDELDDDTAGYFEVFATPASPESETAAPDEDEDLYEVQAAPAPPPQTDPAPQPPPTQRAPAQATSSDADSIRRLHGVEVEVIATLGTTRMQIRDILGLHVGSVVELHRMVGEPVDVTLNGRLIARGEVVVVDEKFAIRVHEIAGNDD